MKAMPFRLAMREEGMMWNAYAAKAGTMEGAILIGSIARKCVDREDRRRAFLDLMKDCLADQLEQIVGTRPDVSREQSAPEIERAGHS